MTCFQTQKSKKINNPLDQLDLTTISNKFLKKLDSLKITEQEKKDFLLEMLYFSPEERDVILDNIIKRLITNSGGE